MREKMRDDKTMFLWDEHVQCTVHSEWATNGRRKIERKQDSDSSDESRSNRIFDCLLRIFFLYLFLLRVSCSGLLSVVLHVVSELFRNGGARNDGSDCCHCAHGE